MKTKLNKGSITNILAIGSMGTAFWVCAGILWGLPTWSIVAGALILFTVAVGGSLE